MRTRRSQEGGACRPSFILAVLVVCCVGAFATASAQEAEESAYAITSAPPEAQALFQAENPAQNLRAYFSVTGASVVPLGEGSAAWELGLDLHYGEAILSPVGNRIDYAYNELPVATWFVNTEAGLL